MAPNPGALTFSTGIAFADQQKGTSTVRLVYALISTLFPHSPSLDIGCSGARAATHSVRNKTVCLAGGGFGTFPVSVLCVIITIGKTYI